MCSKNHKKASRPGAERAKGREVGVDLRGTIVCEVW